VVGRLVWFGSGAADIIIGGAAVAAFVELAVIPLAVIDVVVGRFKNGTVAAVAVAAVAAAAEYIGADVDDGSGAGAGAGAGAGIAAEEEDPADEKGEEDQSKVLLAVCTRADDDAVPGVDGTDPPTAASFLPAAFVACTCAFTAAASSGMY
jgi:hypothetical protein